MALTLLATNNAESVLASAISATDTSLIVSAGTGAEFPDAVAGESYFKLTITDAATGSQVEIVNVTAKAGDIFTIERAQEGTLARAWAANDMVANMMTADTLNVIADFANQAADSAEEAQGYALSAAEFGDNKLTFADTTAGLAGTTSGQYFRVPQGAGNVLAFRYYKNNSGVAVEVAEYVGQGSISNSVRQYATLLLAQNDVAAGNILDGSKFWVTNTSDITLADEYVNNSGVISVTGRSSPSKSIVDSLVNFKDEVTSGSDSLWVDNGSDTNSTNLVVDLSGRRLLYIDNAAKKIVAYGGVIAEQDSIDELNDFRQDLTTGSISSWVNNSLLTSSTDIIVDFSGRRLLYADHDIKRLVAYGKSIASAQDLSNLGAETWVKDDDNPSIIIELVDKSGRIVKYLDLSSGLYYVFGKAVGTEQSSIVYPTFIPEFMDARSYGQSLSIYSQGTPGITTPTVNTLRFDTGVLTYNKTPASLVNLEDPTSSQYMQSQVHDFQTKVSDASSSEFFLAASGLGGTPFSGLEPGTTIYTQFINTIQKAKDLADSRGVQYGMLWFNFQHGETDASQGTGYSYYRQKSKEMQSTTNAHVKEISGLNHDVVMFTYQMATHGRYDGANYPSYEIPLAQLDEAISNPLIQLATPMYIFDYADGLHLTNDGYRHRDIFFSKAQKFYYENKKPWKPMHPVNVSRIGNSAIIMDAFVPKGKMQFSTTRVTPATDGMQGFEIWSLSQSGVWTRLPVAEVTALSDTRAKIHSSVNFGLNDKIYLAYAFTPENRGADSGGGIYPNWPAGYIAGCRGNVCDSDDYESDLRDKNGNPYELRNYLTIFRKEAIS